MWEGEKGVSAVSIIESIWIAKDKTILFDCGLFLVYISVLLIFPVFADLPATISLINLVQNYLR